MAPNTDPRGPVPAATAACYARQSKTDEGELATGQSLSSETQIAKAEQFAALHGWRFDGDLSRASVDLDTPGGAQARHRRSGTPSWQRRPGLTRLWEVAKQGRLQHLIVYKLDRLGRDAAELHQIRDAFHDAGCVIHVVSEGIRSDSAGGELVFGVLAAVAQMERRQISDRLRDVSLQRARKGLHHSRQPGWLDIVPGTAPGDGAAHYALREDVAGTLRRLVALRLAGLSYAEIARTLNGEGRTTGKGATWIRSSVQDALSEHNRLRYRGCAVYGIARLDGDPLRVVTPGVFPPLLDPETSDALDAVQAVLLARSGGGGALSAARKAGGVRAYRKSEHLLSGVLTCGVCHAPMIAKAFSPSKHSVQAKLDGGYRAYYCRAAYNGGNGGSGENGGKGGAPVPHPGRATSLSKGGFYLGAPKVESAVIRALEFLRYHVVLHGWAPPLPAGRRGKAGAATQPQQRRPKSIDGVPAPKRTVEEITAAIDALLALVEAGRLKPADYDRRYNQLDKERQDAERYAALLAREENRDQARALSTLAGGGGAVADWDTPAVRLLLRQLFERVEAPAYVEGVRLKRLGQGRGTRSELLEHVRLVLREPLPGGATAILAGMYRTGFQGDPRVVFEVYGAGGSAPVETGDIGDNPAPADDSGKSAGAG